MATRKTQKKAPKGAKAKEPAGTKKEKDTKVPTYKDLYERHLAQARKLSAEAVQQCRADVRVAFANLRLGNKAVLGTAEQIATAREHLPKVPVDEVAELPNLGRALVFASSKVVVRASSPKEIERRIMQVSGPREQMLRIAEILAQRGLLDKDVVAGIRAGSGKYDTAHDVVSLVGLFTTNAAKLAGLHPFTAEELDKAREDGEWLLENLTPDGARVEKKVKSAAEDDRDRLWTMIVERHELLRKIGYYFHGDELDQYVPRLQSRVAQAVLDEEPVEPAPGAAPEKAPQ